MCEPAGACNIGRAPAAETHAQRMSGREANEVRSHEEKTASGDGGIEPGSATVKDRTSGAQR